MAEKLENVVVALVAMVWTIATIGLFAKEQVVLGIEIGLGLFFVLTVLAVGLGVLLGLAILLDIVSDKVIAKLIRIEHYKQEKAKTLQEYAKAYRVESVSASKTVLILDYQGDVRQIHYPNKDNRLLEDQESVIEMDVLKVFAQSQMAFGIVGGQQIGKTHIARLVSADRQKQGDEVWLIGIKSNENEWQANKTWLGDKVLDGLEALDDLAKARHNSKANLLSHRRVFAVLDDWTAIACEYKDARKFVVKATTVYASVNIILCFTIHADTASAWGVDSIGAALKENIVRLFLSPTYDAEGRIDRSKTRGTLRMPNGEEFVAILPRGQVHWPLLADFVGEDVGQLKEKPDKMATEESELDRTDESELIPTQKKIKDHLYGQFKRGVDIWAKGYGRDCLREELGLKGSNAYLSKIIKQAKEEIETELPKPIPMFG